MRRLTLMTVGFVALFSVAPTFLPLEGVVTGFVLFVGYVAWRTWSR